MHQVDPPKYPRFGALNFPEMAEVTVEKEAIHLRSPRGEDGDMNFEKKAGGGRGV